MPSGFVDYVLSVVNADRAVRVIQAPSDDFKGDVEELPSPPTSTPSTQFEGALSETQDSVQATLTPLKGEDASSERKIEGPEPKVQSSMATRATEEDTHPKVST